MRLITANATPTPIPTINEVGKPLDADELAELPSPFDVVALLLAGSPVEVAADPEVEEDISIHGSRPLVPLLH